MRTFEQARRVRGPWDRVERVRHNATELPKQHKSIKSKWTKWLELMADDTPIFSIVTTSELDGNTSKIDGTVELGTVEHWSSPCISEVLNSSSVILASKSSSEVLCRICRDDSVEEQLISPCMCTGSLGKCHRRCLEEWLSKSSRNYCEICRQMFQTKRVNRSAKEWWMRCRRTRNRRYLIGDCVCFFLLTPLIIASTYLCTQGAWYYLLYGMRWTGVGLIILGAFLWMIFGAWFFMTVRFHLNSWREWRDRNQMVRLVNTENDTSERNQHERSFQETEV